MSGGTFSTSHTNQITVSVNHHICVAKPTQSPMATQSEIQISSIEKEPTGPFTASFTFTASNYFTPNRTAFPDGMNLVRANIKQYNMFSKEELIKAAAPATISLILIIVAIIFTVYYIRKRIQQVQPPDPPDFDSSISDRISGNDSDSLDFYTYSYSSRYSDNNSHDDSEYSDFVPDDMLDMKNELGRYHHL
ncbi:hypothetical protein TRFO_25498 [Tritrichomonas foetus]|uniref:Uncharacterized protein n=1 Tax=Tritrichomonas foetus TaxID=1144522 RepID=A0A1J4K4Z9_9EUKA|nr:hypothetical protein TRFO_25498 [Tritrichomonas foetus]|eukprot:OHT06471.1 hypothetical protein TRFO_25498 [Tritrichomonas foetus]